jgi:hypothetical protein
VGNLSGCFHVFGVSTLSPAVAFFAQEPEQLGGRVERPDLQGRAGEGGQAAVVVGATGSVGSDEGRELDLYPES